MILGTVIYVLFASIATLGVFFAVHGARDRRWAIASSLLTLLFFVGLYWLLEVRVLSQLKDL